MSTDCKIYLWTSVWRIYRCCYFQSVSVRSLLMFRGLAPMAGSCKQSWAAGELALPSPPPPADSSAPSGEHASSSTTSQQHTLTRQHLLATLSCAISKTQSSATIQPRHPEEKHRKFLKHKFYYLFSQIHQLSDHPMNLVSSIQTVHISSNSW